MDGQMNGLMDGQKNGLIGGRNDGWMNEQMNELKDK